MWRSMSEEKYWKQIIQLNFANIARSFRINEYVLQKQLYLTTSFITRIGLFIKTLNK